MDALNSKLESQIMSPSPSKSKSPEKLSSSLTPLQISVVSAPSSPTLQSLPLAQNHVQPQPQEMGASGGPNGLGYQNDGKKSAPSTPAHGQSDSHSHSHSHSPSHSHAQSHSLSSSLSHSSTASSSASALPTSLSSSNLHLQLQLQFGQIHPPNERASASASTPFSLNRSFPSSSYAAALSPSSLTRDYLDSANSRLQPSSIYPTRPFTPTSASRFVTSNSFLNPGPSNGLHSNLYNVNVSPNAAAKSLNLPTPTPLSTNAAASLHSSVSPLSFHRGTKSAPSSAPNSPSLRARFLDANGGGNTQNLNGGALSSIGSNAAAALLTPNGGPSSSALATRPLSPHLHVSRSSDRHLAMHMHMNLPSTLKYNQQQSPTNANSAFHSHSTSPNSQAHTIQQSPNLSHAFLHHANSAANVANAAAAAAVAANVQHANSFLNSLNYSNANFSSMTLAEQHAYHRRHYEAALRQAQAKKEEKAAQALKVLESKGNSPGSVSVSAAQSSSNFLLYNDGEAEQQAGAEGDTSSSAKNSSSSHAAADGQTEADADLDESEEIYAEHGHFSNYAFTDDGARVAVTYVDEAKVAEESVTLCVCDRFFDDETGDTMLQCEACLVWQHAGCMGIGKENEPESYFCQLCDPDNKIHVQRLKKDKEKGSVDEPSNGEESGDNDSAHSFDSDLLIAVKEEVEMDEDEEAGEAEEAEDDDFDNGGASMKRENREQEMEMETEMGGHENENENGNGNGHGTVFSIKLESPQRSLAHLSVDGGPNNKGGGVEVDELSLLLNLQESPQRIQNHANHSQNQQNAQALALAAAASGQAAETGNENAI